MDRAKQAFEHVLERAWEIAKGESSRVESWGDYKVPVPHFYIALFEALPTTLNGEPLVWFQSRGSTVPPGETVTDGEMRPFHRADPYNPNE